MSSGLEFTVFTKPWKMPLPDLARHVKELGFDGIELPVRPGVQVEPANVDKGLPEAVKIMADHGLRIASIAGEFDESTIAACGQAGVPIIRICPGIPANANYLAFVRQMRERFDQALPALDRHGVTIGYQNHCGHCVNHAMGLRHLLEGYDKKHVSAVLDFAHTALNGEPPGIALDIIEDKLCMVNFKNAYWRKREDAKTDYAQWRPYFVRGREGLAVWADAIGELKKRNYQGVVCLTAEYSDHDKVDQYAKDDIEFARSLFQD